MEKEKLMSVLWYMKKNCLNFSDYSGNEYYKQFLKENGVSNEDLKNNSFEHNTKKYLGQSLSICWSEICLIWELQFIEEPLKKEYSENEIKSLEKIYNEMYKS